MVILLILLLVILYVLLQIGKLYLIGGAIGLGIVILCTIIGACRRRAAARAAAMVEQTKEEKQ